MVGRRGKVIINCVSPDNPKELIGFPQQLSVEFYHDPRRTDAWVLFERMD